MSEELYALIEEMRQSIGYDDCWNEATEHWAERLEAVATRMDMEAENASYSETERL